jgi:hypothetical protein
MTRHLRGRLECQDLDNKCVEMQSKVVYDRQVNQYKLSQAQYERDIALAKLQDEIASAKVSKLEVRPGGSKERRAGLGWDLSCPGRAMNIARIPFRCSLRSSSTRSASPGVRVRCRPPPRPRYAGHVAEGLRPGAPRSRHDVTCKS